MFNDQIECYQAIANDLVSSTERAWDKIQVNVERISEDSINTQVIYYLCDGGVVGSTEAQMVPFYFDSLARLISTPEKGMFEKCVFTLHSDGKYNAEFEY